MWQQHPSHPPQWTATTVQTVSFFSSETTAQRGWKLATETETSFCSFFFYFHLRLIWNYGENKKKTRNELCCKWKENENLSWKLFENFYGWQWKWIFIFFLHLPQLSFCWGLPNRKRTFTKIARSLNQDDWDYWENGSRLWWHFELNFFFSRIL